MPAQSMREALEGAFEDAENEEEVVEEEEAGGSEPDTEEPLGDTTEEEPEGEPEPDPEPEPEPEPDAAKAAPEGDDEDPAPEPATGKAPASWKPGAREHWAKVPAEAQKEIQRREKHVDNVLRESADSRNHMTKFNELMRPFEPLMAANNADPFNSIKSLMGTAAGLTLGTPVQKAQVVANIMKQYNVGVAELDQILVGAPAGEAGNGVDTGVAAMIQSELAPIKNFMGQLDTQRQSYVETQQQQVDTDIGTFAADPAHEFFDDVRDSMADLMDLSASKGQSMSLEQAYNKACRMDEDISGVVVRREATANAAARKAEIAGKANAASSVHAAATGDGSAPASASLRGTIENAWDDAS